MCVCRRAVGSGPVTRESAEFGVGIVGIRVVPAVPGMVYLPEDSFRLISYLFVVVVSQSD